MHIKDASKREGAIVRACVYNWQTYALAHTPILTRNEISVKAETSFMVVEMKKDQFLYAPFKRHAWFSCLPSALCVFFFTFILIYILFMQNRKPHDNDDWLTKKSFDSLFFPPSLSLVFCLRFTLLCMGLGDTVSCLISCSHSLFHSDVAVVVIAIVVHCRALFSVIFVSGMMPKEISENVIVCELFCNGPPIYSATQSKFHSYMGIIELL